MYGKEEQENGRTRRRKEESLKIRIVPSLSFLSGGKKYFLSSRKQSFFNENGKTK